MVRWALILAAAGFLGAAIFYWPGVSAYELVCPVFPHVSMGGSLMARFIRSTLVGGVIDAAAFVLVGLSIRAVLKFVFGIGGTKAAGTLESLHREGTINRAPTKAG
jgi:hypothetical protein